MDLNSVIGKGNEIADTIEFYLCCDTFRPNVSREKSPPFEVSKRSCRAALTR